jgi:hypothetical protein
MITQQVVTYIKEQLSRGTDREKIRSNLMSAGWLEEDISQAFSFAEPNLPNVALKIAPTFAVENEVSKEVPVDKTIVANKEPEYIPILKRDNPAPVIKEVAPVSMDNPVKETPVSPVETSVTPEIKMVSQPEKPINPAPILSTVQQTVMSPAVNMGSVMPQGRSIQVDTVRTFGDEGPMTLPVSSSSSKSLKIIAALLALVLVLGNLYIWLVVFPKMNNVSTVNQEQQKLVDQSARVLDTSTVLTNNEPTVVPQNPNEEFLVPTNKLQSAASAFFVKYNSYGGASMPMGSCNAAGTVFVDASVKSALNELSTVAGRVPQCALIGDDSPSSTKVRTVTYIVYIPMEDGGYCIDSTGAALVVPQKPTGLSCTAAL